MSISIGNIENTIYRRMLLILSLPIVVLVFLMIVFIKMFMGIFEGIGSAYEEHISAIIESINHCWKEHK